MKGLQPEEEEGKKADYEPEMKKHAAFYDSHNLLNFTNLPLESLIKAAPKSYSILLRVAQKNDGSITCC